MAPVAPSFSLENNKFQGHEVDPIRWKSAMASHTARILRELWDTLFYPCSGLEAYHHRLYHPSGHSLDDGDSQFLTTPLSNLHTLLTGIALCSRLSVAEVALLLRDSLLDRDDDPKEEDILPFFMQAEIKRLATNGATNGATTTQTGTQTSTRKPDLESSLDPFVLQALSWGVFATDDGRVGVGHAYARKGDGVLIAEGARTGYIVRPPLASKTVGQGLPEKEWQVIGECLLAGRMYGEEALVGDPLYDDVLEADLVGRSRYREDGFGFAGSGIASRDVERGGWKYRSSFWMEPVTLV
ncbi:hypothetical protein QBC45DRAFT_425057 [Copromyces sp. CBS 386.78]|nr:hypothetical protein QBC45DRAFT_425057 [Copromyces sp. CBS 386.78]